MILPDAANALKNSATGSLSAAGFQLKNELPDKQ